MDFQGPLLGATVVSAVSAIPGAIRDIKELLRNDASKSGETIRLMDGLAEKIAALGDISGWLAEAKELHEHLQRLDDSLEAIRNEYKYALVSGRFDFQKYRVPLVREAWLATQYRDLDKLLALAERLRRLEPHPLKRGNNAEFESGPPWAGRLIEHRECIDQLLTKHDSRASEKTISALADEMNQITHQVRILMHRADQRIREEAIAMGQMMTQLSGAINGI